MARSKSLKISIIVPSFNQAKFIERTLDSIFFQNYRPIEVIVIDGASNDGTVAILQKYAERHKEFDWLSEPDSGPADAVNKGLSRVTGDIVGIQSSDDIYLEGAFRCVADAFADRPEAGFLLGDVSGIDIDDHVLNTRRFKGGSWAELCGISMCIPQSSIFFRRELIRDVGYWNGEYYGCDLDYWLRLLLKTELQHVPQVLSGWRRYPEQRTRADQSPRIWSDYWRMIEAAQLEGQPAKLRRWLRASKHLLVLRFPPDNLLLTKWIHFLAGIFLHPCALKYNRWRQYLVLIPYSQKLRRIIARGRERIRNSSAQIG